MSYKHLLIVESPAKAKTLHKYLGNDYEVLASYGHVRDLIPKNGAVEPENDFAMNYELIERNAKHVAQIEKALKNADELLLATDPDREGEAISWHLFELLQEKGVLAEKTVKRVVFYEITQRAILQAVSAPRDIEMNLVNAQQARRALDYLVGFNLSPLLWRKVRPGLSAGRVQSPALRMIVEREREIDAFQAQEFWNITAHCQQKEEPFLAELTLFAGEKLEQFSFTDEQKTQTAIETLKKQAQGQLTVIDVVSKERKRNPAAPFTTSTLQQEAARKLRSSAQKTMRVAQKLYEAGYISYMRTDSVHLAQEAIEACRLLIEQQYGAVYVPPTPPVYTTKSKNAQEAHEAIRPTDITLEAAMLSAEMGADERQLYDLIRKRTLASQMAAAVMEQTSVDLSAGDTQNIFHATGSIIKFAGFMSVYLEDREESAEENMNLLPKMDIGDVIVLTDIIGSQHFTAPPPRFSEASLIKALEEYGIGRPSTYASIISTLQNREYVESSNRRFVPTTIGKVVNDFLTNHFQRYVDYDFTADLEDELDAIARGEQEWKPLLKDFWAQFKAQIEKKSEISREEVMQARELGMDPKTGKTVTARFGRFGPFVQIGSKDDAEKPLFASIPEDWDFEKISLENALELFKLPRNLGKTEEDEEIVINNGRFGPYVRFGRKFVSLPKDEDPLTISKERALELIALKKEEDRKKHIKEIKNGDDILQVLNGRFGPYVTNGSINASIPKHIEPAALTLEDALALLEKAQERKVNRKKKATEKTSEKKAKTTKTAKKAAPKKSTAKTKSTKQAEKGINHD